MKTVPLGRSALQTTRLIYGCMRTVGTWNPDQVDAEARERARAALDAAYDAGYRHFDHADIYCRGMCEQVFGDWLRDKPEIRDSLLITTKVGIRFPGQPDPESPKRYDFSADHIRRSCEQSLRRLNIETIDCYLLHRPDVLMDPEEVAGAFERLHRQGKVLSFGVSNFTPSQVETLQAAMALPLVCNQIELHPARLDPFLDGTLDQCLRRRITPTAWSPVKGGLFGAGGKVPDDHPRKEQMQKLVKALDAAAKDHGVDRSAITLAWLMRHPSGVLPIVGTTDPDRIRDAAEADRIEMDRETWYRLYDAGGGPLP